MKAWTRTAIALLGAVCLAACSTIPVATDYDPEYKLSLTATYAWMDNTKPGARDPLIDNDLMERRVHRAVNEQLAGHGLRPAADGQQPELLVTYHVGQQEKMDIDTTDGFYGYYGYYPCWHCWGPGPYGYGGRDIWVRYYTEGALVIDIVDAKTKKLVWRGAAERRLPTFEDPAQRDAYITETVRAIFQHFPPGTKPAK